MSQLSKLNEEWLMLDGMQILTQHDEVVCKVFIGYSNRSEDAYVDLMFGKTGYRFFEDDLTELEINEDVKLSLLNLIYEERDIQANLD